MESISFNSILSSNSIISLISLSATTVDDFISSIFFKTVFGVMLFFLLYLVWISLLFSVSSIKYFIELVILSPYKITFPLIFLAALPATCINDDFDLKNPSLSASITATKVTSGKSSPSLNKFIPIKTSKCFNLKLLKILTRLIESISLCIYSHFIPIDFK